MNRSVDELIELIELWAEERNIHKATIEGWKPQFHKMREEVQEFKMELLQRDQDRIRGIVSSNENEMLEMGDIIVTAIVMCKQRGYSVTDCLNLAYNKIKDRKGKTINGTFVKSE